MTEDERETLRREVQLQRLAVDALQRAVYGGPEPSDDPALLARLEDGEAALADLEVRLAAATAPAPTRDAPRGQYLGADTTGLTVETTVLMRPIPTGIYHLLDPETDPLVSVAVGNTTREPRRVRVRAYIEGLSSQAVFTAELKGRETAVRKLLPTLRPGRAAAVREVQRATLHVVVDDLDGRIERHDTHPVELMARTSSFNAVRGPGRLERVNLTHYYGAWVTPHAPAVQALIRRAADLLPERQFWGYQGGGEESVARQVGALYAALQQAGITYVNSRVDFGAAPGASTQRTRLPSQSLASRSANCIDGAVLFASLLEGASLSAALAFVPGHAFVGWDSASGTDAWQFVETTMTATHDFAAACAAGQRQYERALASRLRPLTLHRLADLRAREIWPSG